MSQVRYLIDESIRLSIVAALRRAEPSLDVLRVGQLTAPPFGSPDPDLLVVCESSERMLVSIDRASMPAHVTSHQAKGGHTWGVLLVTRRCSLRQLVDDLLLIWTASDAAEWRDTLHYLPLPSA